MQVSRRAFNRMSALAGLSLLGRPSDPGEDLKSSVAIVKTSDRRSGFRTAVGLLGEVSFAGRDVYLKCSYNSPDPYPATTHPEALRAATELLREKGSRSLTLIERSGMGLTREVLEHLRTPELLQSLDVGFIPLEEIAVGDWKKVELPGSHWADGVEVPGLITGKNCIVQVCNLKTHRFGGQFSASLKNSIGLIAKYSVLKSHNYMYELHASRYQCGMIAEVNQVYSPDLILMDAMEVFVKGGPEAGESAFPGIVAASRDRVALDAVGLALLRNCGAVGPVARGSILEQAQLKRAVELGLGVTSAKDIRLLAEDKRSRAIADQLEFLLRETNN